MQFASAFLPDHHYSASAKPMNMKSRGCEPRDNGTTWISTLKAANTAFKAFAGLLLLTVLANPLAAQIISPNTNLDAREQQIVAASRADAALRINDARIIGVRPGTPFLHSLAISGSGPVTAQVSQLPRGLNFDSASGIISGVIKTPGEYHFKIAAHNAAGSATADCRIVCGHEIALTPPMGWNSYDAFGDSVKEDEVLANAQWLKEHLQPFGWDTVVVDFRWYDSKADGIRAQNPEGVTIDEFGRCIPPTNRFPSAVNGLGFKPLADRIHALGLKFGIHIMRGIPRKAVEADLPIANSSFKASQAVRPESDVNRTCRWNRDMFGVDVPEARTSGLRWPMKAGWAWYASIAEQYADWGVDYIKCDDMANLERGAIYPADEIEGLSQTLRASGRSIVLSLSPGPAPVTCGPHLAENANLWRISGDFWDNWRSLSNNFELFGAWAADAGPGHWPDGDMIPFAHICQRNCDVRPDRWTRFTRDEQLTLMSLWALAPSPLMLGMNLPDNDEWTTALLTNPEVLAVNQDPLGRAARRRVGPLVPAEVWEKTLADGSVAVGFFNRRAQSVTLHVPWRILGYEAAPAVRDLWLRKDLDKSEFFDFELPPHGCVLLQVRR